ncbi:Heat shock 70 kDa protein 12A [Entomortierella beljakovae]|nr:Heat shock 70 kDa protein 12A [Entomortierella beljakovae]
MTRSEFIIDDYPILVAIDFGTTFSPRQNIQYGKTPTLNLYRKAKGGKYNMVDWGWKSKLKMDTPAALRHTQLYKFKPYLDEDIDLPPWKHPITIQTAISDYLRSFHDYAAENILQQFGPSLNRNKLRYCLTIPAIWSDKAKNMMRKAAIEAGIVSGSDHPDRLVLISEPEAAALYCERKCPEYNLTNGDKFMICDAGGGTVDLIVYQVDTTSGAIQLSEVTKGHGASCGSMFIDINLGSLLTKKFSKQTKYPVPKKTINRLVETYAYQLKPLFDGEEDQYLQLLRESIFDEFKDPIGIGMDGGYLVLKATELKEEVYEPVVRQVIALINQQLTNANGCSTIFMVGGFGSSTYLMDRVNKEFRRKVRLIVSPENPELAVVCGAVYAGLQPEKVTARFTRRCYGTDVLRPFEEGVDPSKFKLKRADGIWCSNRFTEFVEMGQKLRVNECISRPYYLKKIEKNQRYEISIFSIDGKPARYTTDPNVVKLGVIPIPSPFLRIHPIGHQIGFNLDMHFGLNEVKVEVVILEKKYSTTIEFY